MPVEPEVRSHMPARQELLPGGLVGSFASNLGAFEIDRFPLNARALSTIRRGNQNCSVTSSVAVPGFARVSIQRTYAPALRIPAGRRSSRDFDRYTNHPIVGVNAMTSKRVCQTISTRIHWHSQLTIAEYYSNRFRRSGHLPSNISWMH